MDKIEYSPAGPRANESSKAMEESDAEISSDIGIVQKRPAGRPKGKAKAKAKSKAEAKHKQAPSGRGRGRGKGRGRGRVKVADCEEPSAKAPSFARRPKPLTMPSATKWLAIREVFQAKIGQRLRDQGKPTYCWEDRLIRSCVIESD